MKIDCSVAGLEALQTKIETVQIEVPVAILSQMKTVATELDSIAVAQMQAVTPQRTGRLAKSTSTTIIPSPMGFTMLVLQTATNRGVNYGNIVRTGPPAKDPIKAARERAKAGGYLSAPRPNPYPVRAMPAIKAGMAGLARQAARNVVRETAATLSQ